MGLRVSETKYNAWPEQHGGMRASGGHRTRSLSFVSLCHWIVARFLAALATAAGLLVHARVALKAHCSASIESDARICGHSCLAARSNPDSLNHILAQVSDAPRSRADGLGLRDLAR